MDQGRVVGVSTAGGRGTGYLVGPRLVLTSAHVVGGDGAAVTVSTAWPADTYDGVVVWCGTPDGRDDAALVVVQSPSWVPPKGRPVQWGRLVTDGTGIRCETRGFPDRAQRPDGPADHAHLGDTCCELGLCGHHDSCCMQPFVDI